MKIFMIQSNHPFISLSTQLTELCLPLQPFGIHHFTYFKRVSNGATISLSNKPTWIEDYYNYQLYDSSLFEKPLVSSPVCFDAWFGDYDLEVYRHGKQYYNTMHSISIVKTTEKYTESFLFSTTPDNQAAINYLSNNREILFHFILYLKDRGKSILNEAHKSKITLSVDDNVSSQNAIHGQSETWLKQMDSHKKDFFAKTSLHRLLLELPTIGQLELTQREMQCLYYLLDNRTAAETGVLMNVSRRTAEFYVDNIKFKLGCESKTDILRKLERFINKKSLYLEKE